MRDSHKKEKRGMHQHDDAGADVIIGQDITDRRSAEDALREAEQKYRDIFENAGEGIFQTTPEGQFIEANPALARMHGFDSPEELISSLRDISRQVYVDPARREEFKKLLEQRGVVRGFEHQIFRKDGSKIWVALNARAVRDARGAILYYEGTVQDINERKQAEARSAAFATLARKLSGARTPLDAGRIIVQTARDLFGWDSCDLNHYDADRDLVYQMLNIDIIDGRQTEVFGVISGRKPTARGRRIIDHGPELLLREEPTQFDEDAIPYGDRTRPSASIMTVPIRHADRVIGLLSIQSYRPHSYNSAALDDLQALADHCGEALNRIRAEQALVESEERFRQMADNIEDVLWIADRDLKRVLYVSPAYERVFGRSCESLYELLDSFVEAVHPDDRDAARRMLEDQRNGSCRPFEYRIERPDGSVRWIQRRLFPIRNNDGEIFRMAGIAQDITERKRAQEELQESEERFRQLAEAPFEAIILHDNGTILEVNQPFCRMYGYERAEVIGKSVLDLALPEFRELLLQKVRVGDSGSYEGPALRKDGTTFRAELAGKPIHYQGRGVRVAAIRDVTEQKRNERRQAAQYAVTRVLAESATVAEATPELLQVICESLRWKMGEFWRAGDSPNFLRCVETWHAPGLEATSFIEASRQTELAPGDGLPGRVWQSGQPAWIPDVMTDPRFARAAIAAKLGLRGAVAFPILLGNQTLGVMLFFSRRAPEVDEELLKIMSVIGSQIGQFTERKRAEEALRESEERYRDLVENSHELICTHDLDGLVLSANPAAAAAIGYDLDEYVGKKTIRDLLAPEVSHQFDEYMARLRKGGTTSGIMLVQTRSGERRVWEYYNSVRTEGVAAPVVRGIARDITDRLRAEAILASEKRVLEMIATGASLPDLLETLVREIERQSRGLSCSILLLDAGGVHLRHGAAPSLPDAYCRAIDGVSIGPSVGSCGTAAFRKEPVVVEDIATDPLWEDYRELALEHGLRACWSTPILTAGGSVLGTFAMYYGESRRPVPRELELIARATQMAAIAIERRQAEQAVSESERRYRDIFTFAPVGIYQSLRDGSLVTANHALAEMLAYDSVDELLKVNLAEVYFTPDEREKLIREYEGLGYAIDLELQWKRKDGAPIWIQLSAHAIKATDGLTEYFEGFVRDITERRRAEMERDVISEVIQSANLTSNLDELLNLVHQSLKRVLYAENCCVALYDKQTGLLEAPFFVDLVEANPFPMALSKNCTAKVFSSGQPLLMNETIFAGLLERGKVELIGRPAPSYLAVPLMTPAETIGVIVLQHYEKENVYSQRDVEFLLAVAAQLARAIERKRAEEALRESEERYRDLVENSRELICTHDLDGLVLSANPAAAAAIGYDLDELVAKKTISDLLAPEVSGQFDQYMARLRKEGTTSGSMLVQTRSGERRVWDYYNSLRTEGVAAPIVRGMARDITDRKSAEESARRYRERLEALIHSVDGIVWEADARTFKFTFVSAQAERMLGFPCEQWINEPSFWRDHIHPDDRDEAISYCLESTARKLPHEFEYRMIARDGRSVWLRDLVTVQVEDDHPVTLRGVLLDITERKRAEEAVRESEERYRELFENAKDAIYVHDLSGRYTSVNRAAEQLSGFSRQEILGKHFSNFVSPRDLKHVRTNLCRKLDEDNETIYQVDVVTRTGQRVPVEISSRLIYENGVVAGVQGTARDITDRKRAQEALQIYSQRLIEAQEAERQRIARELHDEIGQVLTAVRINLQSIQRSRGTDDGVRPLDESIAIVDEALGRVRELSIELRPSLLDDLGLSAALRWYVDRYAQRAGIIAEVIDGFEEDGRLPRDLETACFRIAQEALTNVARHAQAGSVSVQLERSRERMLLTVIDDGVGFDIDKLRKSASTASALGLRGMEERALALGGRLEIDSGAERGTRILATFPLKRK